MTASDGQKRTALDVGPREGIEYILATDGGAIAVFLLASRGADTEVHFCFSPEVWGHTKPIAIAFLEWVWANTSHVRLLGPVPSHNRLALRLAMACGFTDTGHPPATGHWLLEIRKP